MQSNQIIRYFTDGNDKIARKDGDKVLFLYLGQVQAYGIIRDWRCMYGGMICFTIELTQDLYLPWAESCRYKAGEFMEIEFKNLVALVS